MLPAVAKDAKEIPPGYVPGGLVAKKVGEKIETPNGLIYEPIVLGTSENGPRDGPPRSGSNCWVRFAGHVGSFDGPVFDSSKFRGSRKPAKDDFIEIRLNGETDISNGMYEALKLMKAGGKGKFIQPPKLSYGEGKTAFEGDELGGAGKVPAGSTLYYEVELVKIIKP